jgi:hypothetical protein
MHGSCLASKNGLPVGASELTTRRAADIIWTLASERTYLALVHDRGWSAAEYEDWLSGQLIAALLP